METNKLQRGDMVVSVRSIVDGPIEVPAGTLGVVYEEAGYYDLEAGPMVRWFDGQSTSIVDGDAEFPSETYNGT